MMRSPTKVVILLAVLSSGAFAAEVDPTTLYEVSTTGSSEKLKVGEKGKFVLAIKSKNGAHVSDEAPLKLEVTGQNVTVEKTKLKYSDSVAKKDPKQKYTDPRFEIPFSPTQAGAATVDAKLVFFICTETLCARQEKKLSVPVKVDAGAS
jgi:hypothetical protein